MNLDLTEDAARALAAHLKHALECDPFPYAPRLDPAEGDLSEIGTGDASARTLAAAEAQYGPCVGRG